MGRTINLTTNRRQFFSLNLILKETIRKIEEIKKRDEKIDFLTFVPDGEPTLDINIGAEIDILKEIGIPIAVLTNSSLLWRSDVREDLLNIDLVSLKVDAVTPSFWRRINRPHKSLRLLKILKGIKDFDNHYKGTIITETMLIGGIDYSLEIKKIADLLSELNIYKAYIAIPTRPPSESWVKTPNENTLNMAFQVFSDILGRKKVEYLTGYEGSTFVSTGKVEKDILSITSVHPIREDGLKELLKTAGASWQIVEQLLAEEKIVKIVYNNNTFYIRKMPTIKTTIK